MANNDKLRAGTFMQKKTECFFAAEIVEGTEDNQIDTADTVTNNLIAKLPPNSLITDAYVHVKTVSDAATSAVGTLGTAEGGTEIMSAADLDAATGKTGTFTGQSDTGSGVDVYFGAVYTGAVTDVGEYVVVIEYLEYTKKSGEYTRV